MSELPPQNVVEEDWDYLIVLDACRYDFFEEIYDEYLSGQLEKRRSLGSATPEWAARNFTGDHDLRYLSANPFINDLGVPLNELKWGASCDYDWTANDHIDTIVDLWQDAWDEDLGAVAPGAVTEHARKHLDNDNERMVIHYLQPHAPYLQRGKGRKLEQIRSGINASEELTDNDEDDSAFSALRERIEARLGQSRLAMKLGMLVELDPASIFDIGEQGFRATIESYYEENVRLAFEAVEELVDDLDGKVVVTADHGEAFGEQGVWEHQIETYIPPLVDVPWLVLD